MSEWPERTLGEVATVVGGGTPSTKVATNWGGGILWLTPSELTKQAGRKITKTGRTISAAGLASSSAKLLPRDTVLLTSRATVGAVALAGAEMATNQGFQSLVPGPDVLPYFLMCWIQANRAEFESRASGSTFAEISGRNVKAIPITIPPFSEQRRIVDLVGSIDSYLEALDGEHRLVEFAYRASTEAMWGAEAKSVRLSDVMSLDIDRVRVEPSARYRLIGILNEGKGLIDKGEISGHETSYATLNRVRDRQVVMRKLTAWEGPIAVVTTQFADTFASAEFPTFAISERLLPSYFGHLCGTSRLRVEMRLRVTGSVQRRKRLSPEQLLSIEVPLPDIEAQQATVERLDAILSLAAALAREKAAGREMRERVLAALLSRQVEIPASYDRLLAD